MPITITHAKSDTRADWAGTVTVGNSTGGTTTMAGSDVVRPSDWNSAHVATVSLSASEVAPVFNFGTGLSSTTAAGGISVGVATLPFFEPFPLPNTNSTLSSPGIGTWYLDGPYVMDNGWGKGQLNCLVSVPAGFVGTAAYSAASTGSVSRYQTFYHQLALYTQGAGASTSRLESVWSFNLSLLATWSIALNTANTSSGSLTNALTLSFPAQWDSSGGSTYSSTSTSATSNLSTSTMASTRYDSLITPVVAYVTGARMDVFGMTTTLPPGVYWLAHMFTSTSSSTGTSGGVGGGVLNSTHSRLGLLENLVNAYRPLGKSVSNSTTNMPPYHGFLATTTSNPTSIINTSDVRGTTGRMYWNNFASTY